MSEGLQERWKFITPTGIPISKHQELSRTKPSPDPSVYDGTEFS